MKDYKVIKVKCKVKVLTCYGIEEAIEEAINKHSRSGWSFEQFSMNAQGTFAIVVLSKPKMM